jgi:hypothetical protein
MMEPDFPDETAIFEGSRPMNVRNARLMALIPLAIPAILMGAGSAYATEQSQERQQARDVRQDTRQQARETAGLPRRGPEEQR